MLLKSLNIVVFHMVHCKDLLGFADFALTSRLVGERYEMMNISVLAFLEFAD